MENNLTDETVLSTPKPWACSTVDKKKAVKILQLNQVSSRSDPDSSADSLGILSLDTVETPISDGRESQINLHGKLRHERDLAQNILQNSMKDMPSCYLKPSEGTKTLTSENSGLHSYSTINESDLLKTLQVKTGEKRTYNMSNESTPRSSNVDSFDFNRASSNFNISAISGMSQNLDEFSKELRNSDVNLAELCRRFENIGTSLNYSNSFTPAELASEKLLADELSWRNKCDVLGGNQLTNESEFSTFDGNEDISEFFRKKSQFSDSFLANSPEKEGEPVALIEPSVVSEISDDSLSISRIAKIISSQDDTNNMIERIFKRDQNKKRASIEFKENEAVAQVFKSKNKLVEPLKESNNLSDDSNESNESNGLEKSMSSQRSTSSLDVLSDGKLPIESTRLELVWGCIKVGRNSTQEFVLRNKSQSRIRMQLAISGSSFKIIKDRPDSEPVSKLPISLHPFESRTFNIIFCPTTIGACIDRLNFYAINTELRKQQKPQNLRLFGYGGYAQVEIQNVTKDTTGKFWLSLGQLHDRQEVRQYFTVKSVGSLAAFGSLAFNAKGVYGLTKINVSPSNFALNPKEQMQISVSYVPGKEDIKHIMNSVTSDVIEVGTLQIVSGSEALRARIRRICRKIKEQTGIEPEPLVEKLSQRFPNEKIPSDTIAFKETIASTKTLMQCLVVREIIVTLERDSEQTLMTHMAGMDETSIFHSLCQEYQTTIADSTLKMPFDVCTVEPTNLLLTPPTKIFDNFLISSGSSSIMQFEISAVPEGVLDVTPAVGIVAPGQTTLVKVTCNLHKLKQRKLVVKLMIYVESELFEIEVKIVVI